MIDFVNKYASNYFSQFGEDGIIEEVLKRIGMIPSKAKDHHIAVEFGAADGYWCSNTANISANHRGWERILYDIMPSSDIVIRAEITPDNVNDLVPRETNVLSLDTDGEDYRIWQAYKGKPEIVIIEINSSFPPDVLHFDSKDGCSYALMLKLGEAKGYFLLCHTGNMIFVNKKYKHLFPEINLDPVINSEMYFNKSWLHSLQA